MTVRGRATLAILLAAGGISIPGLAHAHAAAAPALGIETLLTSWVLDPLVIGAAGVAVVGYVAAARAVNRAHPRSRVPVWRGVAWVAGIAVIVVALQSAIDVYADELLTVHMAQHLLLLMVAPPLLAAAMPVTLALRAASPRIRRGLLLPLLHARLLRVATAPLVVWTTFGVVLWATHFTPLYDAALEDRGLHEVGHLVYLVTGCLFWWPVIGGDPLPRRMRHAWRAVYLMAAMPINTAVGLAIYFAPSLLYRHYATNPRDWGPDPLLDQQLGGLVMWGAGDLVMLAAVAGVTAGWIQAQARREARSVRAAPAIPDRRYRT